MLKKRIKEIYTPRLYGLTPRTPVAEAVALMREKSISCVVALENERPVGIFTERDVVQSMAQKGPAFLDAPLSEHMQSPVLTANRDMFNFEAYNLLASHRIRHLVIVDDAGRAVGALTFSDLVEHLGFEYFVQVKRIGQIMTKSVFTADISESLGSVLAEMAARSISCVIVTEEGRLAGILTERDVTAGLASGKTAEAIAVGELMTRPVRTVSTDHPVHDAAMLMREHGYRRLVVVDKRGQLLGLITQSDIVRGLEGEYIETLQEIITEKDGRLQQIGQALNEKSLYLDNILRSAVNVGIVATDNDFRINYCNPTAAELFGYKSEELLGKPLHDIHSRENVNHEHFERSLTGLARGESRQFCIQRNNGAGLRYVDARVSGILDSRRGVVGFVLMLSDVTDQKRAEDTIRYMAYHDMLTKLPNRTLFMERLELELARARRNASILGLMLLDLDRFKEINDSLGHSIGDELLKALAQRLTGLLRATDTVARLGGDEFLFLLPDIHAREDAGVIADKLLTALAAPLQVDNHELRVTGSIGVAVYPEDGRTQDELVKNADRAMYRAKERGKNCSGGCFDFCCDKKNPA
jgi:diguanylate cyclase (GGDEF)-like protein/PAS domain S-box-containing protein